MPTDVTLELVSSAERQVELFQQPIEVEMTLTKTAGLTQRYRLSSKPSEEWIHIDDEEFDLDFQVPETKTAIVRPPIGWKLRPGTHQVTMVVESMPSPTNTDEKTITFRVGYTGLIVAGFAVLVILTLLLFVISQIAR